MTFRRIAAAFVGLTLICAPILSAAQMCSHKTHVSAAGSHMSGHSDGAHEKAPSKNRSHCDTDGKACCSAAACSSALYVSERYAPRVVSRTIERVVVPIVAIRTAPLPNVDPPPPRA